MDINSEWSLFTRYARVTLGCMQRFKDLSAAGNANKFAHVFVWWCIVYILESRKTCRKKVNWFARFSVFLEDILVRQRLGPGIVTHKFVPLLFRKQNTMTKGIRNKTHKTDTVEDPWERGTHKSTKKGTGTQEVPQKKRIFCCKFCSDRAPFSPVYGTVWYDVSAIIYRGGNPISVAAQWNNNMNKRRPKSTQLFCTGYRSTFFRGVSKPTINQRKNLRQ